MNKRAIWQKMQADPAYCHYILQTRRAGFRQKPEVFAAAKWLQTREGEAWLKMNYGERFFTVPYIA